MKIATHFKITPDTFANALHNEIAGERNALNDSVLSAVKCWNGKRVTHAGFLALMPHNKNIKWRVSCRYGKDMLEGSWKDGDKETEISYYLSVKSGNILDATAFETDNPARYAGRHERNKVRREFMENETRLEAIAAKLERLRLARLELELATADLKTLDGNDDSWHVIRAESIRLAQADDGKGPEY